MIDLRPTLWDLSYAIFANHPYNLPAGAEDTDTNTLLVTTLTSTIPPRPNFLTTPTLKLWRGREWPKFDLYRWSLHTDYGLVEILPLK